MQQMTLNRRSMLLGSLGIGLSHALTGVPGQAQVTPKMVQTVMGPIEAKEHGWYSAGEDQGGDVRGYIDLLKTFLPALERSGVPPEQIQQLIRHNTWNAFAS
jgi:hypothetical protein